MTRKDYVKIAEAIAAAHAEKARLTETMDDRFIDGMNWGIETVLSHVANALAEDNQRFDSIRFRNAARAS